MSTEKYTLEVNPSGFVYLVETGKRIATLYGDKNAKLERGYRIVDLLNQDEAATPETPKADIDDQTNA